MKRPNVESYLSGYCINGELIQTDYDFPRAAEHCGWSITRVQRREVRELGHAGIERHVETVHLARRPRSTDRSGVNCWHRGTDGTVDCRECGVTVSEFICYAAEYLDSLC